MSCVYVRTDGDDDRQSYQRSIFRLLVLRLHWKAEYSFHSSQFIQTHRPYVFSETIDHERTHVVEEKRTTRRTQEKWLSRSFS